MARPKEKDNDKLGAVLPPIRCTEAEKARFKAQAKRRGVTLSQHIRGLLDLPASSVRNVGIVGRDVQPMVDPDLVLQLRSIGNNLNQAVKKFHIHDEMPNELRECTAILSGLLTEIYKQQKT